MSAVPELDGVSAEALPYWIQRADFSSRDFDPVRVSDALKVLRQHDWTGELALYAELNSRNEENCPPGIGFQRQAPFLHLLHSCPNDDGTWLVHYHFGRKRWLWGWRRMNVSAFDLSMASVENALIAFFESAEQRVCAAIGVAVP